MHIDEITIGEAGSMTVLFGGDHQEESKCFEGVKRVRLYKGGMLSFATPEKEYLFVSGRIVSAEKITLFREHKETYMLKNGAKHTLFYEGRQVFSIDDPAVKGIAPKNAKEWIVLYEEAFYRYKDGKSVEKFTLRDFRVTQEPKEKQ